MFLRTVPRQINILVSVAIVLLFLKVLFLNNLPEAFNGFYELGKIFEAILASVIASYIFYLIVIHMKVINDRKEIYPHIIEWTQHIVKDSKYQLQAFAKESGVDLPFYSLTEKQVENAFKKINPNSDAPVVFLKNKRGNWYQFLKFYKDRASKNISKIMSQLIFLESILVSLITKIDDCSHFSIIDVLIHIKTGNQNLSAHSKSFYEYCKYCKALDTYLESEIQTKY